MPLKFAKSRSWNDKGRNSRLLELEKRSRNVLFINFYKKNFFITLNARTSKHRSNRSQMFFQIGVLNSQFS